MPSLTSCRACGRRIEGHPRQPDDETPHLARDGFFYHAACQPRDTARDRAWMEIKAKSPLRPRTDQADVDETPLFVAANEPHLDL